jgi:hypothetical protein
MPPCTQRHLVAASYSFSAEEMGPTLCVSVFKHGSITTFQIDTHSKDNDLISNWHPKNSITKIPFKFKGSNIRGEHFEGRRFPTEANRVNLLGKDGPHVEQHGRGGPEQKYIVSPDQNLQGQITLRRFRESLLRGDTSREQGTQPSLPPSASGSDNGKVKQASPQPGGLSAPLATTRLQRNPWPNFALHVQGHIATTQVLEEGVLKCRRNLSLLQCPGNNRVPHAIECPRYVALEDG